MRSGAEARGDMPPPAQAGSARAQMGCRREDDPFRRFPVYPRHPLHVLDNLRLGNPGFQRRADCVAALQRSVRVRGRVRGQEPRFGRGVLGRRRGGDGWRGGRRCRGGRDGRFRRCGSTRGRCRPTPHQCGEDENCEDDYRLGVHDRPARSRASRICSRTAGANRAAILVRCAAANGGASATARRMCSVVRRSASVSLWPLCVGLSSFITRPSPSPRTPGFRSSHRILLW